MKFQTVALLLSVLVVSSFAIDLFGHHIGGRKKARKDSDKNGTATANVTAVGNGTNGYNGSSGSSSVSVAGTNLAGKPSTGSIRNSTSGSDDIPVIFTGISVSSATAGSGENATSSDGIVQSADLSLGSGLGGSSTANATSSPIGVGNTTKTTSGSYNTSLIG